MEQERSRPEPEARWRPRWGDYLVLALQVLVWVLLGVVLAQSSAPAVLRYGLWVLALFIPAIFAGRFYCWRRQAGREIGPGLCRTLGGTADPATAVGQAVAGLRQALGVEHIALFAIDDRCRQAELLAEASPGEGTPGRSLSLEHLPRLAEVVRSGRPACYADISLLGLPAKSASLLAAQLPACCLYPLHSDRTVVGLLALASSRPRVLLRLHRSGRVAQAAEVLALFIRTAGLQPDALPAQEQIELLREVTTHLSADLGLDTVLSNILTQAIARVGATRGSIFLLDERGQVSYRILGCEGLTPEISPLILREVMERGLAAWILRHGEGTVVEDTLRDDRWMVLPDHAGQVRSAVAVPFLRQGQVQGMLFLTHPEVGRFRREHLELLTSIANQAALAIQNTRLYERVENERRMLAAVLDSSVDAILVISPEGRIVLSNAAARLTLGIENRPTLLGEVILHRDLLDFLERTLREEDTVTEDVRLSDNRTFSVSVAPVRDREGRAIGRVATAHDITHLVELDEMKSRFVSTVSHDLKAPLTAIRGFAELIRTVGPLNDDQAECLQHVRDATESMAHLVGNLLDLGRIEAGLGIERQPVQLTDLLVQAKYNLALPAQEKGILIEVCFPADLPGVQGDPFRLQQVLMNLIGNAIKYTPSGGHIRVDAEVQAEEVVVRVSDTGIGIPPADLPHVFEKFYRVRDTRAAEAEGSGLGLAIVKSIISELGGRVWAESTPNKGSRFYFSLPLTPNRPP